MTNDDTRARIEELYSRYSRSFPEVTALTLTELDSLRSSTQVVLVDVRTDGERAVSMIPDALSASDFEKMGHEHSGATVVAYCTIGLRSGRYAMRLLSRGWQAFNLEGSILAWTHAGRDLVAGGEPTRRVHVYGPRWNLAATGYEAVW